jgi:hypothetical protein
MRLPAIVWAARDAVKKWVASQAPVVAICMLRG